MGLKLKILITSLNTHINPLIHNIIFNLLIRTQAKSNLLCNLLSSQDTRDRVSLQTGPHDPEWLLTKLPGTAREAEGIHIPIHAFPWSHLQEYYSIIIVIKTTMPFTFSYKEYK